MFWYRELPGFGVRVHPAAARQSLGDPSMVAGRLKRSIDKAWGVVCELAGSKDARIHDCRHSFGWRALAPGENPPMIGCLLGHSEEQTTERYAHLDRDWVREGAIRISESLAADFLTGYTGRPRTVREDTPGRGGGVASRVPGAVSGGRRRQYR